MHLDAFLIHLDNFHKEFDIDVTPKGRSNKLVEEVCEFLEACDISTKEHADDEAIDVLVCAIANVKARGINNMLYQAYMKLEKTAEKYRQRDGHAR